MRTVILTFHSMSNTIPFLTHTPEKWLIPIKVLRHHSSYNPSLSSNNESLQCFILSVFQSRNGGKSGMRRERRNFEVKEK